MIAVLCIDDKNGMTLFGRRLSRDRNVIDDFMALSKGNASIAPFSSSLFDKYNIKIDEYFLENAEKGSYCFVENISIMPYLEKTEKIVLYKWNRQYLSDKKFVMPDGFVLHESVDFKGYSHERITREIYVKEELSDEKAEKIKI